MVLRISRQIYLPEKILSKKGSIANSPFTHKQFLVKGTVSKANQFPVRGTRAHATNLFLELVELGDVVEEGGDDGGEEEELFGREVLERVHDGEVSLDRHRPEEHMQGNLELLY